MDIDVPLTLLGGLSPARFMRRHWQKKPLLIRQALPGVAPPLSRPALFDLVGREEVESRLVTQSAAGWQLRHGPFARRGLPALGRPGWTLLVQGLDLHVPAAHELLARFRFVPDARLDDLMLSYASDRGGVGPHVDSYDVFLLQVHGRRRWRIGRQRDLSLQPGLPLKILRRFEPSDEWLLEPGDMLYLPPGWAHDGVAEGECMTCSIGFRASRRSELGRDVLQALIDGESDGDSDGEGEGDARGDGEAVGRRRDPLYADPSQDATPQPALIPEPLQQFAAAAVQRLLTKPGALRQALGEVLSEPKPGVVFEPRLDREDTTAHRVGAGLLLDRRTRMIYDQRYLFINGESYRASGRDARLLRQLADARCLPGRLAGRLSEGARGLIDEWLEAGWMHPDDYGAEERAQE